MDTLTRQPPWYVAGLAFECHQCGRCCAGPEEGYVWLTAGEAQSIAESLRIPPDELHRRYLRKVGRRHTIVEERLSKDCIFLQPDPARPGCKTCSIYSVRPSQCRTWPFWPSNLTSPDAWAWAATRCPGINRGRKYAFDEIEERRIATGH